MSAYLARLVKALVDLMTGKTREWERQTERERQAAESARETLADTEARARAGRQEPDR